MVRKRLALLAWMLTAGVLGLGWRDTRAAEQGHGGGAGHALGGRGPGPGFGFGHGPGPLYRGYYGYPGWFGVGLGGFGLGYGSGWGYGYPYGPYGYGYPVYVDAASGLPVTVSPPAGPVAAPGAGPGPPGSPVAPAPVRLTDTDLMVSIHVPPDAVVRINGVQTTQGGPRREFLTSGLVPGRTYTFVVTARWTGPNGQPVELERRIRAQGGERRNVDFVLPSSPPENDLPPVDRAGR